MPEQVDLQAGGGKREEAALDVGFSDQSAAKHGAAITKSTYKPKSTTGSDSSLQISSILESGGRPCIPINARPDTNEYQIPKFGSFVAKAEAPTDVVFKQAGDQKPPRDNCSDIHYMPLPTSQKIRELSPEEQIPAIQTISVKARKALIYSNDNFHSHETKPPPKNKHQDKLIQDLLVLEDGRKAPMYTERRDLFLLEYKSSEASIVLQPNDKYHATALIYGSAKQKGQAISLLQQYDSIIRHE